MKSFIKNTILLSAILSVIFIFNGCTSQQNISPQTTVPPQKYVEQNFVEQNSKQQDVEEQNSEDHPYNSNFGVVPSATIDQTIEENRINSQLPETDRSMLSKDPSLTTELVPDPDAVTLENYVETPPVITYKYMDSSKFYKEDELPKNKLISRD